MTMDLAAFPILETVSGTVVARSYNKVINRADRKSQVRQCFCFCTGDFWSLLAYESAEQNLKHCLTSDFLTALVNKVSNTTSG